MTAAAILFGALFTVLACSAAGSLLLAHLRLQLYREEERLFSFLSGAAILSTLVFLLTAMHGARREVFLPAGVLLIATAVWRKAWRSESAWLPELPTFWKKMFWSVYAVYGVIYLFNAMAPEHSPDGSTYHLGLVATYFREHCFPHITTNMYASLSQGTEMLFLFAFVFGKHSAAAMVHFAFLLSLPLAMLSYSRRNGIPAAGVCGSLLVFCSPVVGITGISAYNDVATAAVIFGVFYLLSIWDGNRQPGLLIVIGLLCGFCYASKYTAFIAIPYALAFVAWKLAKAREPVWRTLAVMGVCAAVVMIPWLLKNWILVENPVAPFFNRLFPNPYMHIGFEDIYRAQMRHYHIGKYSRIPWEAAVRGGALQGLIGPVFLLAPLALLSLRSRVGRLLLLGALVFALPYATNIGTRFLIPALPFVALGMSLAIAPVRGMTVGLLLAHAVLSLPVVLPKYCDKYAWRLYRVPYRAALRLEPEEKFLSANMPSIAIAHLLEEMVPPDAKVLSFSDVPEAYTSRKVLVAYQAAENNTLGEILNAPLTPGMQPRMRLSYRFPEQKVRKIRVLQTAGRAAGEWTVNELRIRYKDEELARAPEWRIRAMPNPWDAVYAFDNSPATRWRSWQSIYPGMFLEVDLSRERLMDTVVLECSPEQGDIQLRIEAQMASGQWQAVPATFSSEEVQAPSWMRRAAIDELKAHGIDYLLVSDEDFGAEDYKRNLAVWGLTLRGMKGGTRLYGLN